MTNRPDVRSRRFSRLGKFSALLLWQPNRVTQAAGMRQLAENAAKGMDDFRCFRHMSPSYHTPQRADTRPAPLLVDNISDGTHFRAILAYDTGIGARTSTTRVQYSCPRSLQLHCPKVMGMCGCVLSYNKAGPAPPQRTFSLSVTPATVLCEKGTIFQLYRSGIIQA